MNDFAPLIGVLEDPFAALVVMMLAVGALAWRYIDTRLRSFAQKADQAVASTEAITEAIITNHGSKNIGNAIDRLTEHSFILMESVSRADAAMRKTAEALEAHLVESDVLSQWVQRKMQEELDNSEPHRIADLDDPTEPLMRLRTAER